MVKMPIFLLIFVLSTTLLAGQADFPEIRSFEAELLPYFINRASESRHTAKARSFRQPSQAQLFKIAALWKSLSTEFKAAYLQSLEIPAGLSVYKSAGFGIEIYYTTTGIDSVDTSDQWGCDQDDWHIRIDHPNSVPDYIDEVAWSLDSTWSMEIIRFGFKQPYPILSSNYPTSGFKVLIEEMDDYYGLTYYGGEVSGQTGARSLVTIRNNWTGWDINQIINYETYPEKGIRITCAHEFYHAIQYAMVHNVESDIYLDQFPVSWLEATATLMEELAFDYVNDYTQYLIAFFENSSGFSLFSQNEIYDWYANSIAALFLYRKAGIGFIRDVFDMNYDTVSSIDSLLQTASLNTGISWPELLSRFYTESFFTGNRADSRYFVPDSRIIDQWNYRQGECTAGVSVTKNILPYGMQAFSLLLPEEADSVTLQVRCSLSGGSNSILPVSKLILTGVDSDTILGGPVSEDGTVLITADRTGYSEAIAVVTNANYDAGMSVTVEYSNSPLIALRPSFSGLIISRKAPKKTYTLNGARVNPGMKAASGIYYSEEFKRAGLRIVPQIGKENCHSK